AVGGLPGGVGMSLGVVAAAAAGTAWASIAGVLQARFGAHEVITTIMLNFIAVALLNWIGTRWLYLRETQHTADVAMSARWPRLAAFAPALHGSAANLVFVVAGLACLAGAWLLFRTRLGYEIRALGLAPAAAETAHISIARTTVAALVLSGAAAGLAGANFALGYKYYYEEGFGGGVGYMGIAVAVLARNHPLWIIPAALLFGTLSQGGLVVNFLVPKEIVDVLMAGGILSVAIASRRKAALA